MKSRIWMTGVLAAGLCAGAQAEEHQGFYAGTGAGLYYVDFDGIDFDESAPSLRVFGGYRLNEFVAFEAGYANLFKASGDVLGTDVDLDGSAWDVSVRPSLPLNDAITAYGILGWNEYDFDIKASAGGSSASGSGSDGDLEYGVGAAWSVNDVWAVRGEWLLVDVSDADFGMVSVSATYNFR